MAPPDPAWLLRFQHLRGVLAVAAPPGAVLRLDHIGSTAVPGLAAKPVIDIQATVRTEADLDDLDAWLPATGFILRPGLVHDHTPAWLAGAPAADWVKRFARLDRDGVRQAHFHVRIQDRPNQRYPLLVRDFLRAHPRQAAAYAETKRRLAALAPDSDAYAVAKDPVADLLLAAAEDWAAATGWAPDAAGAIPS